MQHPDTLIVRGKTFKLSKKSKTLTYSGRVTDHGTAVVTHSPSGAWVASLVAKDPITNQSTWIPAIGEAATPQAALELAFAAAGEARFDGDTEERVAGPSPSRHDGTTREKTQTEAEHDRLVRAQRLRMVAKIAIALAVVGGLAWAFLR